MRHLFINPFRQNYAHFILLSRSHPRIIVQGLVGTRILPTESLIFLPNGDQYSCHLIQNQKVCAATAGYLILNDRICSNTTTCRQTEEQMHEHLNCLEIVNCSSSRKPRHLPLAAYLSGINNRASSLLLGCTYRRYFIFPQHV